MRLCLEYPTKVSSHTTDVSEMLLKNFIIPSRTPSWNILLFL